MWNSLHCLLSQENQSAVAKQNKIQKQSLRRERLCASRGNDISRNCIWHCVPQKMRLTAEKNGHCFYVSWCNKTINQSLNESRASFKIVDGRGSNVNWMKVRCMRGYHRWSHFYKWSFFALHSCSNEMFGNGFEILHQVMIKSTV
jgi:hypothetical protein